MGRLNYRVLTIFLALLFPGGCATTKFYHSDLEPNMQVNSRTESVEAMLDIYSFNEQCKTAYLGTIALDKSSIELGLVTAQPSYLVVGFSSASFWGSSSGYISYDITLLPRQAYNYEIDVSYIDDIYHVAVYEINQETGNKREMEDSELITCL